MLSLLIWSAELKRYCEKQNRNMKELESEYDKKYVINEDGLDVLVAGEQVCIVSDAITVAGAKVGLMYREAPDYPEDSGWRFFAGDESAEYVEDERNLDIFELNVLANHDPAILKYLEHKKGSELKRVGDTAEFKLVEE